MLRVDRLCAGYGRVSVLKEVDLTVNEGEIVALLGANGAGKTTLLLTLTGAHAPTSGQIFFRDAAIGAMMTYKRVELGIVLSPEGRQVFKPLTVDENLRLGAYRRRDSEIAGDMRYVYTLFPVLAEMRKRKAGDLSGGQQQMLAIGRALLARPKLLLLDEPSLGLAPLLVEQIFEVLARLRSQGVTMLVVEQNASVALAISDRGYVLETGRIAHSGTGQSLLNDPLVRSVYLGI